MSTFLADKLGKWLAIGGTLAVVGVVALTIVETGTPMEQRRVRIDETRIRQLARIGDNVDAWFNAHAALPPDIATLARAPGADLPIVDPVTGTPYEYAPIDATHYRVCAVFDTDTARERSDAWPASQDIWNHGTGRRCFTRKVTKTSDGR